MIVKTFSFGILLLTALAFSAEDYSQWRYYRTVTINTTATGANVSATQRNFPTLVRLNASNFDFAKVLRCGADIRFSKTNGMHLAYQIEQWDSAGRSAAVWVLLDTVSGNSNPNDGRLMRFDGYLGLLGVATTEGSLPTNGALSKTNRITDNDSEKTAFAILGAVWVSNFKWKDPSWVAAFNGGSETPGEVKVESYEAYLDAYFNNLDQYAGDPKTFFVSYDYYPFNCTDIGTGTNGFWALGDTSTYFRHLTAFAVRMQAKRSAGVNLWFLGIGTSVDHFSTIHHPFPTPKKMRYEAYSQMCHGAKGIFWFTYKLPGGGGVEGYYNSPESNPEIYSALTLVNDEIRWIGNALVPLEWQETIHGTDESGKDPESGEPIAGVSVYADANAFDHFIKTISESTSIANHYVDNQPVLGLISNNSIPPTLMISHFRHPVTKQNYLLLFNKSGAGQYYQRWGVDSSGTSTTSQEISNSGTKDFTTVDFEYFVSGSRVRAVSVDNPVHYMQGTAIYSGTTLTIDVQESAGDEMTYDSWIFLRQTDDFHRNPSGEVVEFFNPGILLSFPLQLNGNQVVRRKNKHSRAWEKIACSYDPENGTNGTTACNIALGICAGILISLAPQQAS